MNDLNRLHYTILGDPTTARGALDALKVKGANVASAATVNLTGTTGDFIHITGTTAITAITINSGDERTVVFDDILVLTHNATTLILPGAANLVTAAGDTAIFRGDETGNTRCILYSPALVSPFSTGDVKLTLKTVADNGWVLMNDTTIGNAASGGTGRANADTVLLFTLLWNNTADAQCAVSTGRGGSAAADYAANKTIALPKALGRALATYGAGSGLTSRVLALTTGVETHVLSIAELATHTHVQNAHAHLQRFNSSAGGLNDIVATANFDATSSNTNAITNTANSTATNQNTGSNAAHQNMQPSLFLNTMIKL